MGLDPVTTIEAEKLVIIPRALTFDKNSTNVISNI